MSNFLDYLGLGEQKIFKSIRKALVRTRGNKSTNLLTIKEGCLYVWDSSNSCILTLNIKAARSRDGDNVTHQSLLPIQPILFKPDLLLINYNSTLILLAGPCGIMVMELPIRCPPYGAFGNNDLIFCNSYSLDERLFLYSEVTHVRQVKFHPGNPRGTHIVVLTSDNTLRVYDLTNLKTSEATSTDAIYKIGHRPHSNFPGTRTTYLEAFGEVGVDFDFAQPELSPSGSAEKLRWPVYVLFGDGRCFVVNLGGVETKHAHMIQGLPSNFMNDSCNDGKACSILCIKSSPEVVCIAYSDGTIYHSIVLPVDCDEGDSKKVEKELLCFESIELELGLSTTTWDTVAYQCPIFLHHDTSQIGSYYATHQAGIHSVLLTCLSDLDDRRDDYSDEVLDDIFNNHTSKVEYLVCTKAKAAYNAVVGFGLYYEPNSVVAILADGSLVTLAIMTTNLGVTARSLEQLSLVDKSESSLKKTLTKEPFDVYIARIIKDKATQPILRLDSTNSMTSRKECYELLQRAAQSLRDQFESHHRAKDEIMRRAKALHLMKQFQQQELKKIGTDKQALQLKAEALAEKYEDMKDKQDEIMKRCECLLVLVSQKKQCDPSDAEVDYVRQMADYRDKVEKYRVAVEKLKQKVEYQRAKVQNWKVQEEKKFVGLGEGHASTIKNNLKEMSARIADMVTKVNEYKKRLNLK